MTEISHIFSSLIDIDGTIKIPGLSAEVDPVTDAEKKRYENIDFSLEEKVWKGNLARINLLNFWKLFLNSDSTYFHSHFFNKFGLSKTSKGLSQGARGRASFKWRQKGPSDETMAIP